MRYHCSGYVSVPSAFVTLDDHLHVFEVAASQFARSTRLYFSGQDSKTSVLIAADVKLFETGNPKASRRGVSFILKLSPFVYADMDQLPAVDPMLGYGAIRPDSHAS